MTPLANTVLTFIEDHEFISAERAWDHLRVNSGSLTRRLTEIRDAGYGILRVMFANPVDGRRYARYYLEDMSPMGDYA